MRRRLRQVPGPLWLVVATACVLAAAWVTVTPPLTNADETGHFAYVQHLAETGKPPSNSGHQTLSTEQLTLLSALGLQPTINNANARPSFSQLDRRAFAAYEKTVTHEDRADGDGPNQFTQNGPLYYVVGAIAYRLTPSRNIIDRIFAVRLVGGLLFVAIVALVWLLAAELFAREWPCTLAALVVALQPRLGNTAGSINPDILLCAIWTAFALAAIRTVRRGLTLRRALGLGMLTGASVLTHGRGLALIVPLLGVLALALPRPRVDWRAHRRPIVAALGALLVCGIVALLVTRAAGGGAYGGEIGRSAGNGPGTSPKGFVGYVINFYFGGYQALGPVPGASYGWRQGYIETFFSDLASLDVVLQPHILDYLQFLAAVGLLALWTQVVWLRDRLSKRWREIAVLVLLCVSQILLLHVVSYRHLVASDGTGFVWAGRYLLPLIAVFGVTVAFVASHLPRRAAALSAGAILGVGVVLQLSSLGLTLDRFYA